MKNKQQQDICPLSQDIVFKSFFSRNKQELHSLLKSFLFLSNDISKITLFNSEGTDLLTSSSELITNTQKKLFDLDSINYKPSELLPDNPDDKNFILDLVVEVENPKKHINIEMQVIPHKGFFSRVLSYWARLHSQNLARGDNHYPVIPTHSLVFIRNSFFNKSEFPDFVNEFFIKGAKNQIVTKDLKIVFVELDKLESSFEEVFKKEGQGAHEKQGTLKKSLDLQKKWCYFLRESGNLTKQERSFLLKDKDMSEAMEKLEEISKDKLLHYQALSREGSQLAYNLHMKGTREEGIQEGMQKGIQKGRKEGIQKKQLEVASTMFKKGFDKKVISEILKLPLEEIIKLEKQLKK